MKYREGRLSKPGETRLYHPRLVPMSAIRRFARQIVERFHPDKIILFGSYAYGTPTPDSDVDLLVVMPTRNQSEQAVRIDEAIDERGFALDLLVRTPKVIEERLRWGDWFIKEIMERGKVLYEKDHARVGPQSRKRHSRRSSIAQAPAAHQR
jgi:predicted nucleotidyltransferase